MRKGLNLMNLKELKEIIDFELSHLQNHEKPEDVHVVITTSESSMGARASSAIKHIGMGIDWEHGQLRIEPSTKLVMKGNALYDIKPVIREEFSGVKFWACPKCIMKVAKNDSFCRHCGQKLK